MKKIIEVSIFLLLAIPLILAPFFAIRANAAVGINNLPTVSLSSPTTTYFKINQTIHFKASAKDTDGNIKSMKLIIKNASGKILYTKTITGKNNIDISYKIPQAQGWHKVTITATDNLGDKATATKDICFNCKIYIE